VHRITTITAIIGSMGANEQGKRLALAHLLFNLVTGAIAIVFIYQMVEAVEVISSALGIAPDDHTLKLAVFHTLFNLIGVAVMLPFVSHLVNLLTRLIRPQVVDTTRPRHLDEAALEFPDTAVEAIRKESLHVFDNALPIMVQGLGLPLAALAPGSDPEGIARRQRVPVQIDMEAAYRKAVKPLYSAIIAFISKASLEPQMEQSAALHWLRKAVQGIVEALKDIKHMQKNLNRYLLSDNRHIRAEYDKIRITLAVLLQELKQLRERDDPQEAATVLGALRRTIDQFDDEINRDTVRLIREGLITPQMGSSLMNDSAYAYDTAQHLIETGETLFVVRSPRMEPEQRQVLLEPKEGLESGGITGGMPE